jgi:large subunit ribosomal protein L30
LSNHQADAVGSLLVVNMRGLVNTRRPVRATLEQLKLLRRFNATIVPDNKVYRGMLSLAKEHLAWCELDSSTAESLLAKRAEKSNGVRANEGMLKEAGYSSFKEFALALSAGKVSLNENKLGFRQFFRLSPPRGGFKRSIRRQYGEGGILGPNKELARIVDKMI